MATIKQMDKINDRCEMFVEFMREDKTKVYVINDFRSRFCREDGSMMSWSWADKALYWLAQDGYISVCQSNSTNPRTYRLIKDEPYQVRQFDSKTWSVVAPPVVINRHEINCEYPAELAAFMGMAKTNPKTPPTITNILDRKEHIERQKTILKSQFANSRHPSGIRGSGYLLWLAA